MSPAEFYLGYDKRLWFRLHLDEGHNARLNTLERYASPEDFKNFPDAYAAFKEIHPEYEHPDIANYLKSFSQIFDYGVEPADGEDSRRRDAALQNYLDNQRRASAEAQRQETVAQITDEISRNNSLPLIDGRVAKTAYDPQLAMIRARVDETMTKARPAKPAQIGGGTQETK